MVTVVLSVTQALFPLAMLLLPNRSAVAGDLRFPLTLSIGAGLLGTLILTLNSTIIRQLGGATAFVAITAGLLIASLAMDHMGWSGTLRSALEPGRMIGLLLVMVGVWVMSR